MTYKRINSFFSGVFDQKISVALLKSKNPMGSGYLLKINGNKYFLKKYKKTRKIQDIVFEHDFLNYLYSNGMQVNRPLKFNDKTIYLINSNYYSLFDFADGNSKNADKISKKEKISLVQNIAKMHIVSLRYKPRFKKKNRDLFNFDFEDYVLDSYHGNDALNCLKEELGYIKKNLSGKSYKLPKMVIHNDLSISNIFFKNHKVSMIVDFDDCCFGARISDLINAIFDFYCDGSKLKRNEVDFFINQYSQILKLEREEANLINDLLKYRLIIYIMFYFHYWKKTKKAFYIKNFQKYFKVFKSYDKLLNKTKEQL